MGAGSLAIIASLALAVGCRPSGDRPVTPAAIDVRVVGAGPPMILIAGLGCDDSVWRDAEERWAGRYQLHLVTVAGFAGRAPGPPPVLARARDAIVERMRRLDRPIVVGHSLGAVLAYGVAAAAPEAVRAVVALDGVPYGAALADPAVTPASVEARAAARRAMVASIAPDQAAAQARLLYGSMVTSPAHLEQLVAVGARSFRPTVAQAMYELLTTDLRPALPTIVAPTLLLVAGADVAADEVAAYQHQLAPIAGAQVARVEGAQHFVMLDAPDATYGAIDAFLAGLR